jgi:hypothetical protein
MSGRPFKLKTIVLSGELGGRGISFKPRELKGNDGTPAGVVLVEAHQGYLTDMFYMFDAVKNRQITQHGEMSLQNIGRLCGLTSQENIDKMKITPPRLWTSHSCYNVIGIFGRCVDEWVQVMQLKHADEAMKDAVVRCIKDDPERFAFLHMVYALPTTDRRWAKKDLWVRQSRLMRHDKIVGEYTRTARRMPNIAGDFGIRHDPEADRKEAVKKAIDFTERQRQADEADGPPRQRQRTHRDPELQKWWFGAQSLLLDDGYDHTIGDRTRADYLSRLSNCISNEWVKTLADLQEATTTTIEQSMRASGAPLSKNPTAEARDIVSAIRYVCQNGVPARPSGVRPGGPGPSGVRTAAV